MRKTTLLMLSVLLLTLPPFFLIGSARADDGLDLMNIPYYLAEKFGVSVFIGGLIATLILMLIVLVPIGMLVRSALVITALTIVLMGVVVALGWLPVYIFFVYSFTLALLFSDKILKVFRTK